MHTYFAFHSNEGLKSVSYHILALIHTMVIDRMTFIGPYLSFWKQHICQRGPYLFRFKSMYISAKKEPFDRCGPGTLNITFGSDMPITLLHLMLKVKSM